MGTLSIDASSPATATANDPSASVTTASFTPPAGSLILVRWSWNSPTLASPSNPPTITDSLGTHLTYAIIDWTHRDEGPLCDGEAADWWAQGTGAAMTITVTSGYNSTQGGALRVTVINGADMTDPIGAHGEGGSTSTATVAPSYTAEGTDSWGFLTVCDWDVMGAETAGTGCTVESSANLSTNITYGFLRRTLPDGVLGASTTLTANLPGTSSNVRWVYVEIRSGVEDPTDWLYRKLITIDQTVIDADLTNFPASVSLSSSNFDFSHAKTDGTDIRFWAMDETTPLVFERERHDDTNDLADYWVKVPTVDDTVNTTFWMYYGNASAVDAADTTGAVWDANFLGVYHLGEDPTSAAISHIGTGTVSSAATSATPAYPAGYTAVAGDLSVVVCVSGGTGPPTPSNGSYILVGSTSAGAGTQGAAAGPRRVSVHTRTVQAGDTASAFVISGGGAGAVIVAVHHIFRKSTGVGTYEVTMSGGGDTTDGTGFSVTAAANQSFTTGDMILAAIGTNDNVTRSAETLTATGCTIASLTERSDGGTTTGNDAAISTYTANVTAGLSTAAGVIAATLSLASSGAAVLARIRLIDGPLKDWSGANNHALTSGMVSGDSVAGRVGKGLNVASPDYAVLPTSLTLKNLTAYTVSAWAYADTLTGGTERRHIVDMARGATSDITRMTLSLETNNTFALLGRAGDADALTTFAQDASAISASTWYYVGGVFDSTTDVHKIRVNGTETTNSLAAATVANTDPLNTTKIGTRVSFANEFWDGVIDELRISNIARSSSWLKAEYHAGNGTLLSIGSEQSTSGSLSATLGQPSTTATAQALVRAKLRAVGQPSTTATAQLLSRTKAKAVGQSSTTATAQPLALRVKTRTIGQPTTTSLAQPLLRSKAKSVGQTTTADTAQPLTRVHSRVIGMVTTVASAQALMVPKKATLTQASTTDTAQPLVEAKLRALGQASTTALTQPLTSAKVKVLGQAVATDSTQPLVRSKTKAIGQPTTVASAQPLSRVKLVGVGQAYSSATATSLGRLKVRVLGQPSTVATATALGTTLKAIVNQATATSAAQPLTVAKVKSVGQASATATAFALLREHRRTVGQVSTAATANALGTALKALLGQPSTTASATALTGRKLGAVGQATTTASAQPLTRVRARTLGQPSTTATAQPIALRSKNRLLGQCTTTATAQPVTNAGVKLRILTQVSTTALAQPLSRLKSRTLGQPATTALAQPVGHLKLAVVGLAVGVSLAQPLGRTKARTIGICSSTETATALVRAKGGLLGWATGVHLALPVIRLEIHNYRTPNTYAPRERGVDVVEIAPVSVAIIGGSSESTVARRVSWVILE